VTLDLNPKTETVAAVTLLPGHVVMESHEHPALVTRVVRSRPNKVSVWCRYQWQASREPEWLLGTFEHRAPIEKAVKR
jgi:hypothetical protein